MELLSWCKFLVNLFDMLQIFDGNLGKVKAIDGVVLVCLFTAALF